MDTTMNRRGLCAALAAAGATAAMSAAASEYKGVDRGRIVGVHVTSLDLVAPGCSATIVIDTLRDVVLTRFRMLEGSAFAIEKSPDTGRLLRSQEIAHMVVRNVGPTPCHFVGTWECDQVGGPLPGEVERYERTRLMWGHAQPIWGGRS